MGVRTMIAAAVLAVGGLAWAGAPPEAGVLVIKADQDGKTVTIKEEKSVLFTLDGNATTGFAWSVAKVEGDLLAQKGEVQYEQAPAAPGVVGVGGVYKIAFDVKAGSKAVVKLEYKRAWEKEVPPVKTVSVTFEKGK